MDTVAAKTDQRQQCGKYTISATRIAGGRLDDGLAAFPSRAELGHEEPDLPSSTRIGMGHFSGHAWVSSLGRHQRSAPNVDVLRAHSDPVQDRTITVPLPRLFDEAAAGGLTVDTLLAGLEALLSVFRAAAGKVLCRHGVD